MKPAPAISYQPHTPGFSPRMRPYIQYRRRDLLAGATIQGLHSGMPPCFHGPLAAVVIEHRVLPLLCVEVDAGLAIGHEPRHPRRHRPTQSRRAFVLELIDQHVLDELRFLQPLSLAVHPAAPYHRAIWVDKDDGDGALGVALAGGFGHGCSLRLRRAAALLRACFCSRSAMCSRSAL